MTNRKSIKYYYTMIKKFIEIDRDVPIILPPNIREKAVLLFHQR